MSEEIQEKSEDKIGLLKEKLLSIRKDWSEKINELIQKIQTINKIPEAQVLMLGYRHDLSDLIINMNLRIINLESSLVEKRKNLFIKYKTKSQINLDKFVEMDTVMQGDLSTITKQKQMLEAQRNFYRDSRDTLDKMGFSIKNRIQLYSEANI